MLDERYHETTLKKIINWISVTILKLMSYLPFWIMYVLSDIAFVLLAYVFKYRDRVISTNLKNSFPEKTEKEIKEIATKFYRHFCDMTVETLKAYSMTEKQFKKRIRFCDLEDFDRCYEQGKSVIIMGMHYNNWEWSSAGQLATKLQILMIYNPIRGNQAFENFLLKMRGKWGAQSVPVHKSARLTINFHKSGIPSALWLASDQTPPENTKFWTLFLNQETPYFSGPEKIAARSNQPVFLHHTKKIKRGCYEVRFYKLFEKPGKVDDKEILLAYSRKMEEIIRETPEYYLWSHRRWKHKRPENIPLTT